MSIEKEWETMVLLSDGRARWCAALVSLIAVAALALAAGPAPAAESTAGASALRVARGQVDADVRSRAGKLLGVLHGSVNARGRGMLNYSPHVGVQQAGEVVAVRVRGGRGGEARLVGAAPRLRVALRLARGGKLRGSGRLNGRPVRLAGTGGEALADLEQGKALLVVGRPSGPGYAALRKQFRTVRYRSARHARARLLADRKTSTPSRGSSSGPTSRPSGSVGTACCAGSTAPASG